MIGRAAQGRPGYSAKSNITLPLASCSHRRRLPKSMASAAPTSPTSMVSTANRRACASPANTSPGTTCGLIGAAAFRKRMNLQETVEGQVAAVDASFSAWPGTACDCVTRKNSPRNSLHDPQQRYRRSVNRVLDRYFQDLDGEKPVAIYSLVMKNAEKPMLEFVLRQANGNQTIAAEMLGINRNTCGASSPNTICCNPAIQPHSLFPCS